MGWIARPRSLSCPETQRHKDHSQTARPGCRSYAAVVFASSEGRQRGLVATLREGSSLLLDVEKKKIAVSALV